MCKQKRRNREKKRHKKENISHHRKTPWNTANDPFPSPCTTLTYSLSLPFLRFLSLVCATTSETTVTKSMTVAGKSFDLKMVPFLPIMTSLVIEHHHGGQWAWLAMIKKVMGVMGWKFWWQWVNAEEESADERVALKEIWKLQRNWWKREREFCHKKLSV